MKKIEDYVLSIPDFPEPGIIFRDITSVLQDADGLQLAIDSMQDCLKDIDVDVIAGTYGSCKARTDQYDGRHERDSH